MTTNTNSSEEIELGALFTAINRFFKRILVLTFRFIRFLLRSWLILLILILIGLVAGYFLQDGKTNKETTLIVQANFDSTSFLYQAVDQLNNASATEGSVKDSLGILKIEIEPIVNISDLLDEFEEDRNAVVNLLEDFQAEEGPFSHKAFIHQYRFHEIKAVFNADSNAKNIEMLMDYLRSNPLLENIKGIALQNLEQKLLDNQKTVEQINDILSSLANPNGLSASGLVVMGGSSSSFYDVLEFKKELQEENNEIREDILAQQELVVLINKPFLIKAGSFFSNKMLLFPFLLVLTYIMVFVLRKIYRKMGSLSAKS